MHNLPCAHVGCPARIPSDPLSHRTVMLQVHSFSASYFGTGDFTQSSQGSSSRKYAQLDWSSSQWHSMSTPLWDAVRATFPGMQSRNEPILLESGILTARK